MPDFLIENADQWSAVSKCITWSGVVLRSKEASLSTEEAATLSAKYLNGLGRRRRWPPLIRRENPLKESDPVGWPVLSPQWNHCVIAAAYNFVGRSAQPHQEALNPVPLNLLSPTLNPTSFHACIACPRTEHDPQAVYISMMSPCTCGSLVAKWKCEVGAHLGLSCALRCLCACLLCVLHAR